MNVPLFLSAVAAALSLLLGQGELPRRQSVIDELAVRADGLATALMVLGSDEGPVTLPASARPVPLGGLASACRHDCR
jgi:hypothetical protein